MRISPFVSGIATGAMAGAVVSMVAAGAIARCAEAGYVVVVHQPTDNLIERALIRHVELLGIVRALRLVVATDAGTGPTRNLAYAILQSMFAHQFALTRRNNHAGIGHGDANKGNDLLEHLVGNAVSKSPE